MKFWHWGKGTAILIALSSFSLSFADPALPQPELCRKVFEVGFLENLKAKPANRAQLAAWRFVDLDYAENRIEGSYRAWTVFVNDGHIKLSIRNDAYLSLDRARFESLLDQLNEELNLSLVAVTKTSTQGRRMGAYSRAPIISRVEIVLPDDERTVEILAAISKI